MIARHNGFAACYTNHGFVGQQNLFHQLLLVGIAATAIAQIVLRAGTNTLAQVALLQALDKGGTHHSRQVGILTIRLLQTVERGITHHVDHG